MIDRTRRSLCQALLVAPWILPAGASRADTEATLAAIERRLGGRLGVSAGPAGGTLLAHRADEPFPMCSTFKVLAVAAVLARVDAETESLGRTVTYGPEDLLSYAPVSRTALEGNHGTGRLTIAEACAAAVEWSDNTAANLLLARIGGPDGLTAWLRGIGDPVTRLDRTEPTLNSAIPGDPRDTTTLAAMRGTLGRVLLGSELSSAARGQLEGWMGASRTGLKRLRAGMPPDWPVGDKTGTGANGTFNDVAILRPRDRAPVTASMYITGSTASAEACEAAHAEIGRLVAQAAAL